jgi:alpha-2-macroglobulin
VVQYTSAEPEKHRLPVAIERTLYRLVKGAPAEEEEAPAESGAQTWDMEPVAEGQPLLTTELYLDELTLTPSGSPRRYGVLEVPLPPGATVEGTTWGMHLPGTDGKPEALERARHQPTSFGYAVPVDPLAERARVRHLVRFGQRGTYHVPRARLYRMYVPDNKAFESGAASRRFEVQ